MLQPAQSPYRVISLEHEKEKCDESAKCHLSRTDALLRIKKKQRDGYDAERFEQDWREKVDPHRPQLVAHLLSRRIAEPAAFVALHAKGFDDPLRRNRLLGHVKHLCSALLPR